MRRLTLTAGLTLILNVLFIEPLIHNTGVFLCRNVTRSCIPLVYAPRREPGPDAARKGDRLR